MEENGRGRIGGIPGNIIRISGKTEISIMSPDLGFEGGKATILKRRTFLETSAKYLFMCDFRINIGYGNITGRLLK